MEELSKQRMVCEKRLVVLRRYDARSRQTAQSVERAGHSDPTLLMTNDELQKLHRGLNVIQSTAGRSNIPPVILMQRGRHQDAPLKRLNACFVGPIEVTAEKPWLKTVANASPQIAIPRDHAGFEDLLPMPC